MCVNSVPNCETFLVACVSYRRKRKVGDKSYSRLGFWRLYEYGSKEEIEKMLSRKLNTRFVEAGLDKANT